MDIAVRVLILIDLILKEKGYQTGLAPDFVEKSPLDGC